MSRRSGRSGDLSRQEKRALLAELLRKKAETPEALPLASHGQRALWFLHQLAPDSPAYNIYYAAHVQSEIDARALRRAFQALVDRHPALRTTYASRHGELRQQIHEQQPVQFVETDASGWSAEQLNYRLFDEADRPFDLERGPMIRVALFTRPPQPPLLALTIHHIAVDFWSLDLLIQELRLHYAAEIAGIRGSLPPLPAQYTDYARWQAQMLAGPEGERLWAYWQKQLAGELSGLSLPTDRPRPPVQTYRGASHHLALPEGLTQQLRALTKAEGTTLFVTLLAAFQTLLHRYSGQGDILVGSPMIGRSRNDFARIVGYFINPVVLRADLSGDPVFRSLLMQARDTVLGALDHQDFPFPLLVERLQPKRDPSRSPLFQVAFIWDKLPPPDEAAPLDAAGLGDRLDGRGLKLEPIAVGQRGAPFDLTLTIAEGSGSLTAAFQYNTDLFDAATISRLAGHYQTLLQGIAANPEARISELPLLTPAERRQLVVEWNDTGADYPREACVHELFEAQVERSPDAVAVACGDDRLTFRELNRRANQLAHFLRRRGVGPETLVGICTGRSLEMVVGLLGILKAGGAYVPLDPTFPKERLAFMLADSGAPVLLTQPESSRSLPGHDARVFDLEVEREVLARESADNPAPSAAAENLAYVIYTSGSTGKPKGVQIPHRAVVNLLHAVRRQPGLTSQDVFFAVTSLSFDIAALEIFLPLIVGARLVLASREVASDGVRLMERLGQSGATAMQATPATWRLLLEAGWPGDPRLKILCGGEALPRELADRLLDRGAVLWNLYGPTETTIWSTIHRVVSRDGPISIGKPLSNTRVHLLDAHLRPVPIGVPGDLYIGGDGLARGYLNLPELTAEKFVPDVFDPSSGARLYKTGDVARYLPDGDIEFLGRVDHQVKVSGFRIELEEIETALSRHPAVRQAVVAAVEPERGGEKRLVAYVVPNWEAVQSLAPARELSVSVSELRRFLKDHLPEYMLPAQFMVLDAMPVTPNGKVDRRALPAPDRARPELGAQYVAPGTPVEKTLAGIWAEVLGIEKVGVHDNFFELGGASLHVLQTVAQAAEAGLEIAPELLFVHQTVAELAAAIEPPPVKAGNTIIESLGVYLPPKAVSTKEILAGSKNKILFPLEHFTGIKHRRMAGEDEFAIDLAAKAVEACLANSKYAPPDIDLLICSNISRCDGPDYRFSFEPSTSVRLRKRFGFERAVVFDVDNACTGMFTAMAIVDTFLRAGLIRRGMVVSGEYITHLTKTAQREIDAILDSRLACLTLGDAGAALILEAGRDDQAGLHGIDLYTLGRYSSLCIAKATDQDHSGAIMHTDSLQLTAVTLEQAVAHAAHTLRQGGWPPEALDHIVMHQTSRTSLNDSAREIDRYFGMKVFGNGAVIDNVAERGNTATTSHFVAVMDKILDGTIRSGDKLLFSITGSGLTIGTALYTFDDLPDRLRRAAATGERPPKAQGRPRRVAAVQPRRPGARIESVGVIPAGQDVNRHMVDLAKAAAQDCFRGSAYRPADIDLVIYTGVYRNDFLSEPAVASLLAGELGINDSIQSQADRKTFAFDVFNGAVGLMNACHIADRMIREKKARTAMIATSEIENNATVAPGRLLGIAETGSAIILDEAGDGRAGFGSFAFKYYTDHLDAFTSYSALIDGKPGLEWRRDPAVEDRYLECVDDAVRAFLDAEGLALAQIDAVFPPQIAPAFVSRMTDKLGAPPEKVVGVARHEADYFTSSLPYALAQASRDRPLSSGAVGLIVAVGSGLQVACALYYF